MNYPALYVVAGHPNSRPSAHTISTLLAEPSLQPYTYSFKMALLLNLSHSIKPLCLLMHCHTRSVTIIAHCCQIQSSTPSGTHCPHLNHNPPASTASIQGSLLSTTPNLQNLSPGAAMGFLANLQHRLVPDKIWLWKLHPLMSLSRE